MKLKIEYLDDEDLYDVTNLRMADMIMGLIADTNILIERNCNHKRKLDYTSISGYIANEVQLCKEYDGNSNWYVPDYEYDKEDD